MSGEMSGEVPSVPSVELGIQVPEALVGGSFE